MRLDVYRYSLLLWWALPTSSGCVAYYYTALAMKQGLQDYTNSMPIGTNNYLDLVKSSKVFVDTTLFIKEIIEKKHKSKLILAPRKLGKTTNLLMLKTFLQPEMDDHGNRIPRGQAANYRLFIHGEVTLDNGRVEKLQSALFISHYRQFCNHYLGNYPVIYVTFKDVIGANFTEIQNRIEGSISRAFQDHRYMIPALELANKTNSLKAFKNYLYRESSPDYKVGLGFLIEVLHEYHHMRPFVLLDDYDVPIYNIFRVGMFEKKVIGSLLDYLHAIIAYNLKENTDTQQDVTTSCFELEKHIITPWFSLARLRIVEEKEPLQRFFGFSHTVVEELFRLHNISESLSWLAYRWYHAHTFQNTKERYYNPSSIVNFLHHKKIDAYWEDNSNTDVLDQIVEKSSFMRRSFLEMLSNRSFVVRVVTGYTKDQICRLQDAFLGKPKQMTGVYALSYLRNLGYLIRGRGIVEFDRATITNHEIASIIAKRMIRYYQAVYKFDTEFTHDTALLLINFIADHHLDKFGQVIRQLQLSLQHLYSYSLRKHAHVNPSTLLYTMITDLLLHAQCITKFQFRVYYKNVLGPDFVVYDEKQQFVTVIAFGVNKSSTRGVLDEALHHRNISKQFEKAVEYRFIGVHVDDKAIVQITACSEDKQTVLEQC